MQERLADSGSSRCLRADEGEHVTVCVETIRSDKKAEFDHLFYDVLGPTGLEVNSIVYENTRLLEPRAELGRDVVVREHS